MKKNTHTVCVHMCVGMCVLVTWQQLVHSFDEVPFMAFVALLTSFKCIYKLYPINQHLAN